jgi:hypothetical protein
MFIEIGLSRERFTRNCFVEEEQLVQRLRQEMQQNAAGIYTSVYKYDKLDDDGKRPHLDALMIAPLYFDLDVAGGLHTPEDWEKLKSASRSARAFLVAGMGVPEDQIVCYFSGHKGIHITVDAACLGVQPSTTLNMAYRKIAEELQGIMANPELLDLKIYDRRRLWRYPNSRHESSGLHKVPVSYRELIEASLEEIRTLAASPREFVYPQPKLASRAGMVMAGMVEKTKPRPKRPKTDDRKRLPPPPCVNDIMNGVIRQGNRNNTAIVLASYYYQQGYSKEEATQKILLWGETRCDPPMPESELRSVIYSAYKGGYSYGCQSLSLINCRPELCPIYKKKKSVKGL